MSWLDLEEYKADRAYLAQRLRQREVVLVVQRLQGLKGLADLNRFKETALAGPRLPIIDLRSDDTIVQLAAQERLVTDMTRDASEHFALFERLGRREPFVLHLRGKAVRRIGLHSTVNDDELRSSLLRSPVLGKIFQELVETRTLFLLGVDPQFFRTLIPLWGVIGGPHFAVADSNLVVHDDESRFQHELNLRLLPGESGGHASVREGVLRTLRWLANPQASSLESLPAQPDAVPRIESVLLRQIGPYEELSFRPSSTWSVLLGPNGHGKTSVLRAIALGLLGDDPRAQPAAATLLRVGASQGSIELRVGGRDFRTELYREGTAVHVRTSTRSPLQALGTPMLGFPALRGTAGAAISTPFSPEPNTKPDAGDLLPLVQGGADPRISTVRQWIAQTRLRAELERARNLEVAQRFDATLDRFFSMLAELLPGITVRLGRIEPTTGQVWVITDAGEVPLDALSQGTTAVLGWIGTLLLRLLETHPEREHPELSHAIVLADEIDAHMHPEWQQALVGLVRERLPNLQVIATSHSPLVVGSLGDGKVFRVPRLSATTRVELKPLEEPFAHYRADQILTSSAFGLEHTASASSIALLGEYGQLHANTRRTPAEEARYQSLRDTVRKDVPASPETPEARAALTAVEKVLTEQSNANPERALKNAEALLAMLEKKP